MAIVVVSWSCRTFRLAPWLRDLLVPCPRRRERAGAVMPRPLVDVVCFTSLRLLGELEARSVRGTVCQLHLKLAAGASPSLVRLPDVGVLVEGRVILKRALSGRNGALDGVHLSRRIARYHAGLRVARGKDAQALVTFEAELHRDGATGLDGVEDIVAIEIEVVDRAEEAVPVVDHFVGAGRRDRMPDVVFRREGHYLVADRAGVNRAAQRAASVIQTGVSIVGGDGDRLRAATATLRERTAGTGAEGRICSIRGLIYCRVRPASSSSSPPLPEAVTVTVLGKGPAADELTV